MEQDLHRKRNQAIILFSCGLLLAALLAGLGIWANLESTMYGFINIGDTPFTTLHCPLLMSSSDTAYVTAKVANTFEKPKDYIVEIEISSPLIFRKERNEFLLQPGESKSIRWEITKEDIDLHNFIFAYAYQFANYPQRSKGGTCGTFVVHLPGIPGWLITGLLLVLSAGLIFGGLLLWERAHPSRQGKGRELLVAFTFVAVITYLALFFAAQGMWMLGIIALIAVVLSICGIVVFALYR